MRLKKNKNQLLILLLAVGFLIGIIYENIISRNSPVLSDVFRRSNLEQYLQTDIVSEKYFWYVAKARILLLAIIFGLSLFKWKKLFVGLSMTCCGFFVGSVAVASIMQLGMKGILVCIAAVFPQGLFYVMAYGMLFMYWFHYPESRWNRTKMMFVILMFLVGIVVEAYLNPVVIKLIIEIL